MSKRLFGKVAALVAAVIALGGAPAFAGEWYLDAASAMSVASANDCTVTTLSSTDTAGDDHEWMARVCADGATNYFVFNINYPADASTSGTPFTPTINWTASDTGSGNVRLSVDMACVTSSGDWNNLTYGTAAAVTCAAPASTANKVGCSTAAIAPSGTLSTFVNQPCVLRVARVGADGADTYTGSVRAFNVRLNYN